MYKVKDLNRETIIESFYEKELFLRKLQMSYYSQTNSRIRDKIKVSVIKTALVLLVKLSYEKRIRRCYKG